MTTPPHDYAAGMEAAARISEAKCVHGLANSEYDRGYDDACLDIADAIRAAKTPPREKED